MRRVKERTSAVLLQTGLGNEWWADSMEYFCYLRHVQDLLSDEKTPCERRFGIPLNGPVIPFGAMVEYHSISAKDQSRLHQFGAKVLPGIFLGHALHAGGIWKGDIQVADFEELEQMDASEIHARRLDAKAVFFDAPENDKFVFPVANGTVQNLWRRSTSEAIHLNLGSSRTRRGTRSSSRRIRRTPFSITTTSGLNARWCGS